MSIEYDAKTKRYTFRFKKTIHGQEIRRSKRLDAGYTKAQAERYDAEETLRLYEEYRNPSEVRVPILDAVLIYIEKHLPDLKDGYGIAKELDRLGPYYEGRFMDELHAVGEDYRKDKDGQLAPATIKNKLSYLRAACNYAQAKHKLGNPGLKMTVDMPVVKNERHFYLERHQILAICKKLKNRTARATLRVAFYSGMRISEILRAGESVETMRKGLGFLLEDTKNGDRRIAAMHPRLRVLRKYFPLKYKKRWIQRLIRKAMNEAGFEENVLHDVRHSTASALINAGVDSFVVGRFIGHKSTASMKRYTHVDVNTLNNAALKIN